MSIVDDWIYIGLLRDERPATGCELYRVSIDGAGMMEITPWNDVLDYSIDDDGWIYYLAAGEFESKEGVQLWRMRHDGEHTQPVMQQVGRIIDYSNGEAYYSDVDDDNIYAVSFFGTDKRKIVECESALWFLKVVDDWVYYVEDGVSYKVRKDGSDLTEISVETPLSYLGLVVVDNWLTYRSEDLEYCEMVRISDIYDTDDLYDLIFEDQLESMLRNLDPDDPADQFMAEKYKNLKIRKYE